MATILGVLRWLKLFFLHKPLAKATAQIALFMVFYEGTNAKIGLCTYLRLTLNATYLDWASISVLREYSFARGYN